MNAQARPCSGRLAITRRNSSRASAKWSCSYSVVPSDQRPSSHVGLMARAWRYSLTASSRFPASRAACACAASASNFGLAFGAGAFACAAGACCAVCCAGDAAAAAHVALSASAMMMVMARAARERAKRWSLPNNAFSFDDADVAIEWWFLNPLDAPARLRPGDLDPVDRRRRADAEHLARIVRREIAAARRFEPRPPGAAERPGDARANRVAVAADALQRQPQP